MIRIIDPVFSKQTMTHLPLLAGGIWNLYSQKLYKFIWPCK